MITITLLLAVIAGLNTTYTGVQNTKHIVMAIHHHTTRPMYRHVLKPVGIAIKNVN